MYSKYLLFVVPCITNVPIRTILDDEISFSLLLIYTAIGFLCCKVNVKYAFPMENSRNSAFLVPLHSVRSEF